MELPRISIVTPSYNQSKYIEETILSIINQGYKSLEYIIIDGCSTDKTISILRKYERYLSYWVSESDRGQSEAINKGLIKCTGDLITFQNSDDVYLPGTFSFVADKWLQNKGCGAIVGGFKYLDQDSVLSEEYFPPRLPINTPTDLSLIQPEKWRLHQVSMFYSRKALDYIGRYVREDLHYVMDRELLFRVCKEFQIVTDNKPYAAFRRHPDSKTMSSAIQFGNEFAHLYLSYKSSSQNDQHVRQQIANIYLAKGYLHYAKYQTNLLTSNVAFLKAAIFNPKLLVTRYYWSAVIKKNLRKGHKLTLQ